MNQAQYIGLLAVLSIIAANTAPEKFKTVAYGVSLTLVFIALVAELMN